MDWPLTPTASIDSARTTTSTTSTIASTTTCTADTLAPTSSQPPSEPPLLTPTSEHLPSYTQSDTLPSYKHATDRRASLSAALWAEHYARQAALAQQMDEDRVRRVEMRKDKGLMARWIRWSAGFYPLKSADREIGV